MKQERIINPKLIGGGATEPYKIRLCSKINNNGNDKSKSLDLFHYHFLMGGNSHDFH